MESICSELIKLANDLLFSNKYFLLKTFSKNIQKYIFYSKLISNLMQKILATTEKGDNMKWLLSKGKNSIIMN